MLTRILPPSKHSLAHASPLGIVTEQNPAVLNLEFPKYSVELAPFTVDVVALVLFPFASPESCVLCLGTESENNLPEI